MKNKIGFVITYYQHQDKCLEYLRNLLISISNKNFYIILATHSSVPIEIQQMCDYVIFEKENLVDNRKYSHGIPENLSIKAAFEHLKFRDIDWAYKVCYDVIINDFNKLEEWKQNYKYQFVSCQWSEGLLTTHSFFANVNFVLYTFTFYKTIDEMFAVSNVLETCWQKDIVNKGLSQSIYLYKDKESFFGSNNKMDVVAFDYNKIYKQKYIIITPHLSTGGLPQYLLWHLQQLLNTYDVYVIEYNFLSPDFIVQRTKVIELLKDKFYSLGNDKNKFLDIINEIHPDIIHFEEMPETFVDKYIADKIYNNKNYKIIETTHGSEKVNKTYIPNEFLFVCRFSQEQYSYLNIPSNVLEYPIIYHNRPERTKALNNLDRIVNKKH